MVFALHITFPVLSYLAWKTSEKNLLICPARSASLPVAILRSRYPIVNIIDGRASAPADNEYWEHLYGGYKMGDPEYPKRSWVDREELLFGSFTISLFMFHVLKFSKSKGE